MAFGQTLMQWQATGCHMALLFRADGRFVKITHQYAQYASQQQITSKVGTSASGLPVKETPSRAAQAAEAIKLAGDIESLFHDCESIIQAAFERDSTQEKHRAAIQFPVKRSGATAAAYFMPREFFARAIGVCNADGSVSAGEASLFCELFTHLMPGFELDLPRNDLEKVSTEIRRRYIRAFEEDLALAPLAWRYLEQNDRLKGTNCATRYRELLLRMANMFASAEGVRSEAVMCRADRKGTVTTRDVTKCGHHLAATARCW